MAVQISRLLREISLGTVMVSSSDDDQTVHVRLKAMVMVE